jgi:hypothetical protein
MDEAWAALRVVDFAAARDAFLERLTDHPEDPEALDGLGRALWWLGQQREGIDRRREAYAIYSRRGDRLAAANLATYLAAEHRIAGENAAGNGWLGRAERLLEDAPPCPEQGWLEVEKAKRSNGRPEEHETHARSALALSRELSDCDLEAAALSQLGLALVDRGEMENGLRMLDEAMTTAMGGEASDPLAIGDACCTTLVACDRLADLSRANEWCRAVVDFTGRRGYTPLHLWCRTVYARVLISAGDWERAERELLWAFRGWDQLKSGSQVLAIARLAELRVRQGRLGEAQTLLQGREDHPVTSTAAVALAVAQGEPDLACALASRRLEALRGDTAECAVLLPLCGEARLAAGDLEAAQGAAEQLSELGEGLDRPDLSAFAGFIRGASKPARGQTTTPEHPSSRHWTASVSCACHSRRVAPGWNWRGSSLGSWLVCTLEGPWPCSSGWGRDGTRMPLPPRCVSSGSAAEAPRAWKGTSPLGSARCSISWWRGCPTRPSRTGCSSARRPPSTMSGASWASSGCGPGRRSPPTC